jgi:hypothetical protein
MDLEFHYENLNYIELISLAQSKGYSCTNIHTKKELINALLFVDQEASAKSSEVRKINGMTLVICHGRAHARILEIDYNNTIFVDLDEYALPDINQDFSNLNLNSYFDTIILIHCPIFDVKNLNFLRFLNEDGIFYMTSYSDYDNSLINDIKMIYGLAYIGIDKLKIYKVYGVEKKNFLTFVN